VRTNLSDTAGVKPDDLRRRIRRLATKRRWTLEERQGKGSHLIVTLNGRAATIPMHRTDLPLGTFHTILKALGLSRRDLEDA
jgi:hypothetical protein